MKTYIEFFLFLRDHYCGVFLEGESGIFFINFQKNTLKKLQFSRTLIFQEAPFLFELCRLIFDCFAAAAMLVMPQSMPKIGFSGMYIPKIYLEILSCCLPFFLKIFSQMYILAIFLLNM